MPSKQKNAPLVPRKQTEPPDEPTKGFVSESSSEGNDSGERTTPTTSEFDRAGNTDAHSDGVSADSQQSMTTMETTNETTDFEVKLMSQSQTLLINKP